MELSEILDSLSGSGSTVKTASHNNGNTSASLGAAIDRALEGESFDKVASHSADPTNDLIKIARDISTAEQSALVKEAHLYGRSVADGFAARMSQYEGSNNQSGFNKTASDDSQMLSQAMQLGYQHASSALNANQGGFNKTASADFVKTSAFAKGQEDAVKVASYVKGQEDAVKVASYVKGQEEAVFAVGSLSKIAHDYADYGFKVGNSILRKL